MDALPESTPGRTWQAGDFTVEIPASGSWTVVEDGPLLFALAGEIYGSTSRLTLKAVAAAFAGADVFPEQLDGSFLLARIDRTAGACAVYTDRTASRKFFFAPR